MTAGRAAAAVALLLPLLVAACPVSAGDAAGIATGDAALRAGRFREAEEAFRAVLAADAGDREARLGLARALSFSGAHAGGEREYRALLASSPGDVEARLGLADVLAWRKEYAGSEAVLAGLATERPGDPEVWARRGKVALWSGNRGAARHHFEKVLALDPGNAEGRRGLAALAAPAEATAQSRSEAEAGYSNLRMRRANPGSQAWIALTDRSSSGWEVLGRGDYLHRFGKDEGRATAGVTRKRAGGGSLRVEGGVSPGAEIFSRAALEAELGWPLVPGLAGYLGGKFAHYAAADSWNALAALEYYVLPKDAILARYVFSSTSFDVGGTSRDGTWLLKAIHFVTDDDRAWLYYSHGTEGYATGTFDQLGSISSDTVGAGGRLYPSPRWGVEGNVEWQDRAGGERYLTLTAVLRYRY